MLENNPMLEINIKVWRYFSVILNRSWRVYAFVAPVFLMNAMQFVYLFQIWGDLGPFLLNTFFATAIFNALLRTCLVIINRNKFEAFLCQLDALYLEIETNNDVYAKATLRQATHAARLVSIFNLTASFCNILGSLFVPLFSETKVHPFGVAIPGIDMTTFPVYEIIYALELPTPLILTVMYMPFVSLFATFAMFGKAMLKALQHELRHLCRDPTKSDADKLKDLKSCIDYFQKVACYINNFHSLVTWIVSLEFMLFGAIVCLLLFCINIIDSSTQIIAVIFYIFTMLYIIFNYYWQANELVIESIKVSEAAYAMEWYDCSLTFKKTLLLFIMRSQSPLKIMVGNIYPMTLETFQSLLNASYSYFTLLRRVHDK